MRLVHLSDLHLGFRQYQRLTPNGINQREADVAGTFRRAIDRTIALEPDLVVIAGDVFHNVRPTNPAILQAFQQFARLCRSLPRAAVVMVAGNHDLPRTTETGCILRLFSDVGVTVVDTEPARVDLVAERGLSVYAVPDMERARLPRFEPDPAAKWNVLLLHGEVEGMLPANMGTGDRSELEISRAELGADRWDYVALGHYHVYREVEPNAFYAGSIDYTSANPWGELAEERQAGLPGKGIVERDLSTGEQTFHHIAPARPLLDLAPVRAQGMTAAELDRAIAERVESVPGGIDEKIVRLLVRDVPRHIARELDHKALRDYKRRALHFHLDTRRPEILRSTAASGAPGKRPSLADTVRAKLETRVLPGDVDRNALVELGLRYLSDAEAVSLAQGTGATAAIPSAAEGGADADPAGPAEW